MDILSYINAHHDQLFYFIAGLGLAIELSILGLSGPLLFISLASFITGILVTLGVVSGWEIELLTLGVLTLAIVMVLWGPFKKFQNRGTGADNSSDMIGKTVPVSEDISRSSGSIRYSGINWPSRLAKDDDTLVISAGNQCIIVAVEGNTMLVDTLNA
tara:strand:- start:412 stop:885 length:474 start_codon:yes stop_codon:yes gene_type:complete